MKLLSLTGALIIFKLAFCSPFNYNDYHSLLSRTLYSLLQDEKRTTYRKFMDDHGINGHKYAEIANVTMRVHVK